MLNAFLTFVNDYVPELSEKKTLLAVSGGVDSMVMAEIFRRAEFPFAIAHCNFGLRGAESDGDEKLVRRWAENNRVAFHVRLFKTFEKAKLEGISTQMAARDLRYAWFDELMEESGYNYLATAHHADDNIETVLLNMIRGTGLAGILGIAPVKGRLIRPLLFVSKAEIRNFAQNEELDWREDSSNASSAYRRNELRHRVLPVLREMNPSLDKTFGQNLERLRAVGSIIATHSSAWRQRVVRQEKDTFYVSIPLLRQAGELTWLLHEILQEYGFNYPQAKQVAMTLDGISGKQFFSASHSLTKDREELIVEPLRRAADLQPVFIQENSGVVTLSDKSVVVVTPLSASNDIDFRVNSDTAYFDAGLLRFPLTIRPWRSGDRLQPFGMGGKSKKVSDLLVEAKVPLNRKKECLVLADKEGNILWVPGFRSDERFKVTAKTTGTVRLEIMKKD